MAYVRYQSPFMQRSAMTHVKRSMKLYIILHWRSFLCNDVMIPIVRPCSGTYTILLTLILTKLGSWMGISLYCNAVYGHAKRYSKIQIGCGQDVKGMLITLLSQVYTALFT